MACIDWVKWRKKHCSEFYGYVHTVYKIDITWTNDNDLMTWQWETLHYALYDIWYKKINRTLYIGWPGCGIDREEGRRGGTQYYVWSICDIVTVRSPYITLRHKLWEQGLLAAIKYFQDQNCVGAGAVKIYFLSSYWNINVVMLSVSQWQSISPASLTILFQLIGWC